ncbi:AAA family ATPase [Actinomycetospora termitidis]|uniref:BTAD domain-containing putative transcriptional regulator n=1 Tax=Actinomycetospora termitidis TaxID=3053470 RepID=A0ABT7MFY9_9PSEU|nr:AAA family ATPase [Actinomycetospora sp. Odt1-22]MDL5159585.1 BTAD domain-containing putative transcriptional regulator [Actinomycetospora sp. Odt1-22]
MTEVRLLGAVEVVGTPPVRSTILRSLLAHLALDPGRAVPTATLIDELYDTALPKHPSSALHVQVTRLRKWVAPAVVESTGGGYVLQLPRSAVDLSRFLDAAGRDPAEALAEYRGEAFPGCRPGPRLAAEGQRVRRRHREVVEEHARCLLADGRSREVVALTAGVLDDDPDHEGIASVAALALHAEGRTGEALKLLATTRAVLRTEHGVDPGEALRSAERAVLDSEQRRRRDVVGRGAPLATIREALDDTRSGRIVVVAGEAGIGKSTLLRAALEEAARRGGTVGRGLWEHDQAPFAAWVQALHAVGVAPPSLRDPTPGRTLRRRLAAISAEGLVLVILDDAHRADPASLHVLRGLGQAGLPSGVVVLVAAREPDTTAHPAWSDAAADLSLLDDVVRLPLTELDEAGTRAMVVDAMGWDQASQRLVAALWSRTGGHPLHLSALLAELKDLPDDESREAATRRVPARLRPLLDHQLGGLPEPCRSALEAMAVLGPLPLAELAGAVGTDERTLARDVRPAVVMTLVEPTADGFAFRHDLTAAAVLDVVPAVVRAQLHRARLAALGHDAEPFTVLRHAVGAAALLPAVEVADAHLPAAFAAYRDGALATALELLDAAAPTTSRPVHVRLLRGLVREVQGRVDEAADLFDAVVADPDAEIEDSVSAALGDDALGPSVAGRPRRLERLRRVHALPLTDLQRARVLRGLVVEEQQIDGDGTASLVGELLAMGDGGAEPMLAAEIAVTRAYLQLGVSVPARDRVATARRAAALARAADAVTLRLEADELLVAALVGAGSLDEALAVAAELGPEAERRHRPRTIWATRLVEASALLAGGKIEEADQAAQEAFGRAHELGIADALGAFGAHLVIRHLLTGSLPVLGGLPARTATDYPREPAWSAVAAVDAVQGDDLAAAAEQLAEFHRRRHGREGGLFDRVGLCLAACAAFALDDRATADLVLTALPDDPGATVVVGIGAAFLGPLDLYRGLALAARGEQDGAHRRFRAAQATATALGWYPWADAAEGFAEATGGTAPGRPSDTPGPVLPLGLRRAL